MSAAYIRIYGRVQGIFFRYNAIAVAKRLDIRCIAENLQDGSVRIDVSGPQERLEKFVAWCNAGPPLAKIERVEVSWISD